MHRDALHPAEVAIERVARPFRDAWGWFDGLHDAKSKAASRAENEQLRQQVVQNRFAVAENARLKALLQYREGPSFPRDFEGLAAAVIARPAGAFADAVVVSVGADDGVEKDAPVVTAEGLVGLVTRVGSKSSRVTLLTDQQSAVSALDVGTGAVGIVRHGRGVGTTLILDRVPKEKRVRVGDTIVTAGWRTGRLESLYPLGIQIGRVTSVGQADTDLYKQVQVEPFADFASLDAVVVLVPKVAAGERRAARRGRRVRGGAAAGHCRVLARRAGRHGRPASGHARVGGADSRLRRRCPRGVRRRAARRRGHAGHAGGERAAADDRGLLGRPLWRDHGPPPPPRAVPRRRGDHDRRRRRRLRPLLHAGRGRLRASRPVRHHAPAGALAQSGPDAPCACALQGADPGNGGDARPRGRVRCRGARPRVQLCARRAANASHPSSVALIRLTRNGVALRPRPARFATRRPRTNS